MLPSWGREFVHRGLLDQKIQQRSGSSGFTVRPKLQASPEAAANGVRSAPMAKPDLFLFLNKGVPSLKTVKAFVEGSHLPAERQFSRYLAGPRTWSVVATAIS